MIKQISRPGGDTLMEYFPRETFHQGIPTGMSYLYNVRLCVGIIEHNKLISNFIQ